MAFDAGMMRLITSEINGKGVCRVEKIYQPLNDEIVILLRSQKDNLRLLINAGSNYPRMNFTKSQTENPLKAPMFCMLLRKHLCGGKLLKADTLGFERVCKLEFEAYDEMGFKSRKYLFCEIMGKYSNVIFTDEDEKIISALKTVDFSTSSKRQILVGMKYEIPPKQDKIDPMRINETEFEKMLSDTDADMKCEKFITSHFCGMATSTARQITYNTVGNIENTLGSVDKRKFLQGFFQVVKSLKEFTAKPYIVYDETHSPVEFSYLPLEFYPDSYEIEETESFSELVDTFFHKKGNNERIKQKSADITRLISNAETRITKKIALQKNELEDCKDGERYKLYADLITANMYLVKRGEEKVSVCNYYDENQAYIEIPLDSRLSPSQNAQRYYKRYSKSKNAKIELTKQIKMANEELEYIHTVADSLTKAESENDLSEIRDELYHSGYASKMKNYSVQKQQIPKPMKFQTSGGYVLYCGKNNKQNDYVTTKLGQKTDWWFHVKNIPGSHVLMQTDGKEPSEKDFTEAAEVAAFYSKADGDNIAVDYTQIKNVKKPSGSKPGFVIYTVNWTAYVTPDERKIEKMMIK